MTKIEERKFLAKFLFILLFIYICLFEFILEPNKIFPKPTLLGESFISIWKDYDLLFALIITTSVVYLAVIIGYGILYLIKNLLCRIYFSYPSIISASKIFKYFPAFFYAVMFDYWFHGSYLAEFCFAILAFVSLMTVAFIEAVKNVKEDYLLFAKGLNLKNETVFSKVIWNYCRPELYKAVKKYNFYLWVIILLFEYIADIEGLGRVYSQMLAFKDLAGLVSVAVIMAVIIYLSNKAIGYLSTKLIHWKNE
jgi:ABC-type nitrate/sulfonate/bicarbonate transport system permease component